MHILLIVPEYPPHHIGGGGEVYEQLAKQYSKSGHKVTVIFGQYKSNSLREPLKVYEDQGITFYEIPEIPYPKSMPNLRTAMPMVPSKARELKKIIKDLKPNVAHIHGYGWPFVNQLASICMKLHIPYVYTLHGYPETQEKANMVLRLAWRVFEKVYQERSLRNASWVTAISDFVKNDPRNIAVQKSTTIYNGIDLEKHAYPGNTINVHEIHNVGAETLLFYSLGRLAEMKGFQNIIRLIPILMSQGIDIKYIVAGEDDGYLSELQALVKALNLEGQVEFVGQHDLNTKLQYINQCDFFVVPSIWEPFGLIALEGAIFNKPIITSEAGGLAEVLAGYPNKISLSEPDIATSIKNFHPSEALFDLSRFDWKKISKQYLALLEKAATNE
ncbi:MAG: glycosyltransferase family 4 protein [Candidatus Dojkabacteria bacterium]|nr:MAG: glycosyltransferase family 4 protein [Candidatus Dojkabacteria bacterium]